MKIEPTKYTDCLATFPCPITASKPKPRLKVQFLNLKQVYEKVQSRVNKQSKQRLSEARVRMVVSFDAQISEIKVGKLSCCPILYFLFSKNRLKQTKLEELRRM